MSGLKVLSRRERGELIKRARAFADAIKRIYAGNIYAVVIIGSVARDLHGPRSDLDIVVIVEDPDSIDYGVLKRVSAETIPVPTDIIVISRSQYMEHKSLNTGFYREICSGIKVFFNVEKL